MKKTIIDHENLSHERTELCEIMAKHGSDKGMGWHNYTLVYNELFKKIKTTADHFFELGIGTINSGASLRGWKEYFKKANIYGADILLETLFTDHRIQTFECDQLDKNSIQKLWSNFKAIKFDVILEDGLHTYEANISFLENSLHMVKDNGYYIIEDVYIPEISKYDEYLKNSNLEFKEYQIVNLFNEGNNRDNVLVIIKK